MPKKTARAGSRPAQQRSKEEQWRKRMAAQTRGTSAAGAGGTASAVSDRDAAEGYPEAPETPTAGAVRATASAAAARPRAATSAARTQAASAAALQRRAAAGARATATRARMGANTLSVEDEMRYIKHDIRTLIILTAVCLVVIIALSFVVPSIVK
jgi:hypothetical protein